LPPVGALDQLRGANGDGLIGRARSSPWLLIAIVAGGILILAWIGWAVYVTSDSGARAGLGVVIAWPAMLAALAIIALPFIGFYLLISRLSEDSGSTATAEPESVEDEPAGDDDEPEDSDEEEESEDDEDEEESDDDSKPDSEAKPKPKAKKS
jgi:hypothetical protein